MDGADVVIAQAKIQIQPRRNLPVVLPKESEAILEHFANGISLDDACRIDLSLKKIRQCSDVPVGQQRRVCPWIGLQLLVREHTALPRMLGVVDLPATDFATEAELMFPYDIGQSLVDVTGNVFASGSGSKAYLVEAADTYPRGA